MILTYVCIGLVGSILLKFLYLQTLVRCIDNGMSQQPFVVLPFQSTGGVVR